MMPSQNETAAQVDETRTAAGTSGVETSAVVPRKDIAEIMRIAIETFGYGTL